MGLFSTSKRTRTRYLVEVPHDPGECTWVMDEIIGRGPQYQSMFWWGCQVDDHRAWAFLDGFGRDEILEEALPPVLRDRAVVHRLSRMDGRDLRRRHEEDAGDD
jgi:hypothetical protein